MRHGAGLSLVFLILVIGIKCASAHGPSTQAIDQRFGDASNDLRAGLEIYGRDSYDYHPGEAIRCEGYVQNVSDHLLHVAADGALTPYAALHVRIPGNRQVIQIPILNQFAAKTPDNNSLQQLEPRAWASIADSKIRLGDPMPGYVDASTRKPAADVSFRKPGQYEFWLVYSAPAGHPHGWSGTLTSNHVTITVSDLPVGQRLKDPTPKQLEMLQTVMRFQGNPKLPATGSLDASRAQTELEKEIGLTENEGLALHIVDVIKADPARASNLVWLIQTRYGGGYGYLPLNDGIDGPYLQRYAQMCVDDARAGHLSEPWFGGQHLYADMSGMLVYLRFHPEPSKLKDQIIDLAKQSANITKLPPNNDRWPRTTTAASTAPSDAPYMALPTAWKILLDANVLHDGMTLDEAEAILGPPSKPGDVGFGGDGGGGGGFRPPTTQISNRVDWHYVSRPFAENPGFQSLRAVMVDGKLTRFGQSN